MPEAETPLQTAERHVREIEARIARQEQIISELNLDRQSQTAALAQRLLNTMRTTLAVALDHVEIERRIVAYKGQKT